MHSDLLSGVNKTMNREIYFQTHAKHNTLGAQFTTHSSNLVSSQVILRK